MGGYYYTTKTGDMWDYIAWKVYGDERRMEILLRAEENAALIDVYMFSAGEKVWCPKLPDIGTAGNIPPWRMSE